MGRGVSSSISPHNDSSGEIDITEICTAVGVIFVFAPLSFVRKIEKFRFGFMFGVAMILLTVVTISCYCFGIIHKKNNHRRDFEPPTRAGYFPFDFLG